MLSPSMQPQPDQPGKPAGSGTSPHFRKPAPATRFHFLGDDVDPSITVCLSWSGSTVTISSLPAHEGGSISSVTVDGNAATAHADGSYTGTGRGGAMNAINVNYDGGARFGGSGTRGINGPTALSRL